MCKCLNFGFPILGKSNHQICPVEHGSRQQAINAVFGHKHLTVGAMDVHDCLAAKNFSDPENHPFSEKASVLGDMKMTNIYIVSRYHSHGVDKDGQETKGVFYLGTYPYRGNIKKRDFFVQPSIEIFQNDERYPALHVKIWAEHGNVMSRFHRII
jgi:hypothetical protein